MPATSCPATVAPSAAVASLTEAVAACHSPRCHLAPSLGAPSSLPEHLTPTLMFRVDVGMQVARALPPPLQPTQQSPPSCPGGPGCRYCTKVSKSLLFYALFYLSGWDHRWEPPATIKSVSVWGKKKSGHSPGQQVWSAKTQMPSVTAGSWEEL